MMKEVENSQTAQTQALNIPVVSKRKPEPPKPPKDREVHLGGFSRHKRD